MQHVQKFIAWLRAQSRGVQTGVGCGALIVACIVCAGVGQAIGGGSGSGGASSASQQQTSQQTSQTSTPRATNTPAKPTATSKPKAWVTIPDGHFEGNGNNTTPTIHLKDGMRIVWSYTPTDPGANLCLMEVTDTVTKLSVASLCDEANQPQGKSGTYNVHGDEDVYLDIQADSITYSIDVQEFK